MSQTNPAAAAAAALGCQVYVSATINGGGPVAQAFRAAVRAYAAKTADAAYDAAALSDKAAATAAGEKQNA